MSATEQKFLPYGHQIIDEDDIRAVVEVLRSDWLTTGPMVGRFEEAVAQFCDSKYGVAVSSGTAGLHAAMHAAGLGAGDEVIVPSLTFAASANAALYVGAKPVFAEIDPHTLLIDPKHVESLVTPKTKAIVAVDYAGQPCDYKALRAIADKHKLLLIADACHSLGGSLHGKKVGTLADLSVLSFHPVKHITTAEGGMILTNDERMYKRMRIFRNHGIDTDHRERAQKGTLGYEMVDLGYNYRLNDVQCALGLSQLKKLGGWIKRRNEIAALYEKHLSSQEGVALTAKNKDCVHAYHLFVVLIDFTKTKVGRDALALEMKKRGIGVNVHYPPVHLHPYYQERFGHRNGMLPVTEAVHAKLLSLPMYPALTDNDVNRISKELTAII